MDLIETYAFTDLSGMRGQDHVKARVQSEVFDKPPEGCPKAVLIRGPSGTGKTTLSNLISTHTAVITGRGGNRLEMNAAEQRRLDDIRTVVLPFVSYMPMGGGRKTVVFEEAHGLDKLAMEALTDTMDKYKSAVFIFVTTQDLPDTLTRRCMVIDLVSIPEPEILAHITHIAKQEGMDHDESVLKRIARTADGNMGMAINLLISPPTMGMTEDLMYLAIFKPNEAMAAYDRARPGARDILKEASRLLAESEVIPVEKRLYLIQEAAWHYSWVVQGVYEPVVVRSFIAKVHTALKDHEEWSG